MGIVIAVASGKGGTGKTSVTGGVAAALAMAGQRVLCIDMDIGLRNLDISLGLSDRALMDFTDVAQGICPLQDAVVEHSKIPGLYLLTAPARSRREEPVVQPAPVAMSAARAVTASSIAVRTERNRTLPALPAKCVIGVRSFRQSFVARGKGPVSYSLPARARSSQTVAMSIAA